MKRVLIIIILAVCPICVTIGQSLNNISDLGKLNLNGKVKATKQRFYDAINENGVYTKGKANSGDSNNYENIDTEFDVYGNIAEVSRLRFQDEGLVEKDIYRYENGKLVEIVTNNSKGDLSKKLIFEYDEKGNKIKESFFARPDADPAFTTYSYNEMGLLNKTVTYYGFIIENKYDKKGNILSITKKNDGNTWLTKYTYNENNKLIRTDNYVNKKVVGTVNYSYDENGKLIPPKSNFVFEELDKQGNWIKRVKFNHGIYFFIERTIEYYE